MRNNVERNVAYHDSHGGKHDAIKLLGDILHKHSLEYGMRVHARFQATDCSHHSENLRNLSMFGLSMPMQSAFFRL